MDRFSWFKRRNMVHPENNLQKKDETLLIKKRAYPVRRSWHEESYNSDLMALHRRAKVRTSTRSYKKENKIMFDTLSLPSLSSSSSALSSGMSGASSKLNGRDLFENVDERSPCVTKRSGKSGQKEFEIRSWRTRWHDRNLRKPLNYISKALSFSFSTKPLDADDESMEYSSPEMNGSSKSLEESENSGDSESGNSDDETLREPQKKPSFIDLNNRIYNFDEETELQKLRFAWDDVTSLDKLKQIVLDPQGYIYITWLFIVTTVYLYNCWTIPLRSTFPYQTPQNKHLWFTFDYLCDVIYLLDVLIFQPRVMYLDEGFWVNDFAKTRTNYMKQWSFKMDVLALLPSDLLYLFLGTQCTWLRLPRLLKIHSFKQSFAHLDRILASPHIVRVARTLTYMIYLIHINACAYYAFSAREGLGSNGWTYNGKGNAYIRCFYFATKTATSIGKNPKPENEIEYMFMTVSWLMGVFVFALLIGQIRDIIATATRSQSEYFKLVDDTLEYLRCLKLPEDVQHRVKMWFTYTWQTQHCLDENRIMDCLPQKTKTDIALNVHINVLNKVSLFRDCNDEALLRELVLKLRSVIFLPGDTICRCGDVGYEMYIVKTGNVQVLGKDEEVLATLKSGSVFGEISLLAINGGNRRTATVRSIGFSNLFVLSKNDLNETLINYPEAQRMLKKKAEQLMIRNDRRRSGHGSRDNQTNQVNPPQENPQSKVQPIIVINNPGSASRVNSPVRMNIAESGHGSNLNPQVGITNRVYRRYSSGVHERDDTGDGSGSMRKSKSFNDICDNLGGVDEEWSVRGFRKVRKCDVTVHKEM